MDSVFVHKMWDEQEISKLIGEKIPFPLLSDSCAQLGKLYGVFSESASKNLRGSFIIDPSGVVQSMEIVASPVGRDFDEAIRQLEAHQLVKASQGCQVAPTAWKPGAPVLEPSPEIVGKVGELWTPSFYFRSKK